MDFFVTVGGNYSLKKKEVFSKVEDEVRFHLHVEGAKDYACV